MVLKIRGDNVGALFLVVKMRPANAKQAIIARELALRFVELSFPPDAIHTPGIAHVAADELSRVYAPKGSGIVNNSIHPLSGTLHRQWHQLETKRGTVPYSEPAIAAKRELGGPQYR